jgi:uncharacterized protein
MQNPVLLDSSPSTENSPPAAPWNARELWVGFAFAILFYLGGSLLGALASRQLGLAESPYLGVVLGLVQLSMALPPVIIMLRHGRLVSALGLDRFHWRMLLETVLAVMLGFCGSLIWGLFLLPFGLRPQEPLVPLFGRGLASFAAVFIVGAILAPIVEEVVFRGFLFGGLRKYLNVWPAILISGALFGALHFQLLAFPVLFLLGIILAALYQRTGSLWMPILMHFCINAVGLAAQYYAYQQGII